MDDHGLIDFTAAHSRRKFLSLAGGAAAAAAFLTACGDDDDSSTPTAEVSETAAPTATATPTAAATAEPTEAADPWTYTDAVGKTIALDQPPERIVAWVGLAAILYDFGVKSTAIWGPGRDDDGNQTQQAGRLDLDEVESLTSAYRELDLESLAVLQPDVLLVPSYGGRVWPLPAEEIEAIEQIVPVVAIAVNERTADDLIEEMEGLAASFAAPTVDGYEETLAAAKADFEAASDELRAVAAARPDMSVLVLSLDIDSAWIGRWHASADLSYYAKLGVRFLPPLAVLESDDFEQELSWETINTYQTDVILLDERPQWQLPVEDRPDTWALLPAAQAAQIGTWNGEAVYSYQGMIPLIRRLAEELSGFTGDFVDEAA